MDTVTDTREVVIGPNPGPQTAAFASSADITVYGGQAGGGKSYLTLLRMAVHADQYAGYSGIIFRRELPMVKAAGGLWEESLGLFPIFGAKPNSSELFWQFPKRAGGQRSLVQFRSMQHEADLINYQGASVAEFCFEEATHFLESQFWWLFSRLRTTCGMKARCMLTCNPDPDSWVRRLIDWWIGPDGLAIPERANRRRWFVREGDTLVWGDTPAEVLEQVPHLVARAAGKGEKLEPKSVRFIPATLADNPKGDKNYRSTLEALPKVERERLLGGNWNVRAVAGSYFQRSFFEVVDRIPGNIVKRARGWDLAGTKPSADNKDPDWTAGVALGQLSDGRYIVDHAEFLRDSPAKVEDALKNTASADGLKTVQAFWQDPAQAGKSQREHIVNLLRGWRTRFQVASEDKETYAGPVSSDAENKKILVLRGPWNELFFSQLESFPMKGKKKDAVDALSRAHRELASPRKEIGKLNGKIPGI